MRVTFRKIRRRGSSSAFPPGPAISTSRSTASPPCDVETNMFSVLFEVHPKAEHWDTYLGVAKMLRPEIERIDGFIDNIRYKSLTREGWIFSLSGWRDEKALVRWRTQSRHH